MLYSMLCVRVLGLGAQARGLAHYRVTGAGWLGPGLRWRNSLCLMNEQKRGAQQKQKACTQAPFSQRGPLHILMQRGCLNIPQVLISLLTRVADKHARPSQLKLTFQKERKYRDEIL